MNARRSSLVQRIRSQAEISTRPGQLSELEAIAAEVAALEKERDEARTDAEQYKEAFDRLQQSTQADYAAIAAVSSSTGTASPNSNDGPDCE